MRRKTRLDGLKKVKQNIALRQGDALVIVDAQNDFLPGGALAVPQGEEVIPIINQCIGLFERNGLPIFATRDWHPPDHCSFHSRGGPWPEHCIMFSHGAELAPDLNLPPTAEIISKPSIRDEETYSAFERTGFAAKLQKQGILRLFICGLATDYCVLNTVLAARSSGFEVLYLRDAIRAVNARPDDGKRAEQKMKQAGAAPIESNQLSTIGIESNPLLTDLYQLTMLQGYFVCHMEETAVFEFSVRELPRNRNFLIAAGLEQALEFLQELRFDSDELDWLAQSQRFDNDFIDSLRSLRFTGDVDAVSEGTVFFAQEPVLRVTAPLPEAQLVESRLINLLQFQTLVASKAARCVLAAQGKALVDFGLRRAHGAEAGCLAARASYLGGFDATSNVLAARMFSLPLSGTMAHSFILARTDEAEAFNDFVHANPDRAVLVLDSYDTEAAARKVVKLAATWKNQALRIQGVRLDSGDLSAHAFAVREILDEGGLPNVSIFASGHLDEYEIQSLVSAGAPIDGFGVGSKLTTSADAPYLDCAYKLQEYAGRPTRKWSEGKTTLPGPKQIYRADDSEGRISHDVITLDGEPCEGEPLLNPVMRGGRRVSPPISLEIIRQRARAELMRLPDELRGLEPGHEYSVEISESVRDLAHSTDEQREYALH
jgi:nicotinate phosphoribosyltransferase